MNHQRLVKPGCGSGFFWAIANCILLLASGELFAQGRIQAIYHFPELSIEQFQNAKFPGSVTNDRKILLGSVGSDLWRGPIDGPGEFWMVTDRGPNGQVRVDGKNRRTFQVPEFNPAILRVKTEGDSVKILQSIPIVGPSGKPVTRMPNLKGFDEIPYDYAAQKELAFNVNGLDTEGLVRFTRAFHRQLKGRPAAPFHAATRQRLAMAGATHAVKPIRGWWRHEQAFRLIFDSFSSNSQRLANTTKSGVT